MNDDFTNAYEGRASSLHEEHTSGTANTNGITQSLAGTLYHYKFWIKFCAITSIIYGIFACITIVGILYAWLPIWQGLLLNSSTIALEKAFTTGNTNELKTAVTKVIKFFKICGIVFLISIAMTVLQFFYT